MFKFKIFVDMDQEEQYLNAMARSGYVLKRYNSLGFYTFEKSTPQNLHYKIDYRVFKAKREYEEYKLLFQDSGWIHVFGSTYSGSQYFLPTSDNSSSPDIFSDIESKAARYKRLLNQCILGLSIMLVYFVALMVSADFNLNNLGYLTPGLWQRTGLAFWSGFLFETPFVIFRFLPFVTLCVLSAMYGYCAVKSRNLYKNQLPAEHR